MGPHPTPAARPALQRYDFIDAIRGLAFLGVLVHHSVRHFPGVSPTVGRLAVQGHEGVELFFLVSALTLFLSLDSRRRAERRPVLNFFIRRFFRIAPLFYAGAVFYFWLDRALGGGAGPGGATLGCILSTLTFSHGWNVDWINRLVPGGWSIAVEMNFYLLVPWLFRRLRGVRDAAQLAFAALIGAGASTFAMSRFLTWWYQGRLAGNIEGFLWYWLPTQLPIFCLGFVLFFILRPVLKDEGEQVRPPQPDSRFLLLLAGYLMVAVTFTTPALYLGHFLFGIAFLLLAWSLALHPTRLLVNPITKYMGKVSFSAYLTHFAVMDLMERGLLGRVPSLAALGPLVQLASFVAIATLLTVAVSTLTYRWIEVPGQDLGRSLIRFLEGRESLLGPARPRIDVVIHGAEERRHPTAVISSSEPIAGT